MTNPVIAIANAVHFSRRDVWSMTAALLMLGLTVPSSYAGDQSRYKVVDGVGLYYGVMPAGIVRGQSSKQPERSMHGGAPLGNEVHLTIGLFDAVSGVRIENAKITARISPVGLASASRPLEPVKMGGVTCYGGFFPLAPGDQYKIRLDIERPGVPRSLSVEFPYDHRLP